MAFTPAGLDHVNIFVRNAARSFRLHASRTGNESPLRRFAVLWGDVVSLGYPWMTNKFTRPRGLNQLRKLGAIAVIGLTSVFVAVVPISATRATASPPVTTTMALPFSGILGTDIEGISVSGTLHIETQVALTPEFLVATVHTNISNATGVGTTSGQRFVAVGASLQTCGLPVGLGANAEPVQLTLQFRLSALPPLSPEYQRVREGSLLLILQLTFRNDGTVSGATSAVGRSRFSVAPAPVLVAEPTSIHTFRGSGIRISAPGSLVRRLR
jgi:hypothetical protein